MTGLDLRAALDDIAATVASAALAEVRGPGGVWRGGAGAAPEGRFRAGSITKTLVATVVLQLVGEGRIALDDPVPDAHGVTLRHLLQHTSGLPDYAESDRFRALYGSTEAIVGLRHRTWSPAELLAFVADRPPLFPPGSSWAYSNTNYLLLGLIVERLTGHPYATEAERRILRPLGLRDTSFPGADPHIPGPHPRGYLDGEVDITDFNHSFAGPAGELLSTTADLNRFFRALMTGDLLPPAQLTEMRTARATGGPFAYGLGLASRHLPDDTPLWGHNGGTFGFEAFAWTTPDATCQATVAITPRPGTDPAGRVDDFLAEAFRQAGPGQPAGGAPRSRPRRR